MAKSGFPDIPIDNSNDDQLKLGQHSEALTNFVRRCATPMTIGIQGDWGSGKTSLMNLVKSNLEKEIEKGGVLNIWFNTWQYSQFGNEENLATAMLVSLLAKIQERGNLSKDGHELIKRIVKSLVAAVSVSSSPLNWLKVGVSGKSFLEEFYDTGKLDSATIFEKMKDDFRKVINDVTNGEKKEGSHERVVVFIDDLDRLPPVRAVELLEVIKNIIDVEGCVFILAIDYAVVTSGLRQRKGYDDKHRPEAEERKFFDKIFQVPYRMPTAQYEVKDFLVDALGGDGLSEFAGDYGVKLVKHTVENNPRSLKRALNIYTLFCEMLDINLKPKSSSSSSSIKAMAFIMACVQVGLPKLHSIIAESDTPFYALFAMKDLFWLDSKREELEDVADDEKLQELVERLGDALEDKADPKVAETLFVRVEEKLTEHKLVGTREMRNRVQSIAGATLEVLDLNRNGKYSSDERKMLNQVIKIAKATTLADESDGGNDGVPREKRRHISFSELYGEIDDLEKKPYLVYCKPNGEVTGQSKRVCPDYGYEGGGLYVINEDGESMTLAKMTEEVHGGKVNSSGAYWVIEGTTKTVNDIRKQWRELTERIKDVDTSTEDGREHYKLKILSCLEKSGGAWVSSTQIREDVGGSQSQAWQALSSLIECNKVRSEGNTRATKYQLVR